MVVANFKGNGPHYLFYGHYDVQPIDPIELWKTDPFIPVIEDTHSGKVLRSRGSSDDKGQLMTFIEACRSFINTSGTLPCEITILLEGEEEILLDAFLIAKKTWPNLCMIIAPRHPKRSKQIGLLITSRGLTFVTRSSGKPFVREHHDILLADSLGEMDLWYAQCGICIIGGTFGEYGGHTPYEPSAYGCAILHGAHVDNFRHEFNQLTKSKATVACREAQELATTLLAMKSTSVQEIHADLVKNALSAVTEFEQLMDDVLDILTTDS